jgi:beta-glucanase (GH16 family)
MGPVRTPPSLHTLISLPRTTMAQNNKTRELETVANSKQVATKLAPQVQVGKPAGAAAALAADQLPLVWSDAAPTAPTKSKPVVAASKRKAAGLSDDEALAQEGGGQQATLPGEGWLAQLDGLGASESVSDAAAAAFSELSTARTGGIELAQLELPANPSSPVGTSSSAATSAAAPAAGGVTSSLGGMAGLFGAAAGLGLAAGGGGGGSSAGAATPVKIASPTTAAPVPTAAASDVISVFSDKYTNVPVSNWNPYWSQSGALSDANAINGDHIKRVLNLNYQGVQIATLGDGDVPISGVLDVSAKGHLHIDFWLEAAGSFTLKLVSKNGSAGPLEGGVQLAGVAGWNSVDINLAQFDLVDLSKVIQMLFVTGGASGTVTDFHFDNVYFAGTYSAGLEGRLVNGYIKDAEVFQDNDGDGALDNDKDGIVEPGEEPYALTDAFGRFNLVGEVPGGGPLIAKPTSSTVDQSTGLPVTNVFKAPAGASVISPLSTLLEAGSASGLTELQLKTAFGIDANIDLLEFNPVQAIKDAAAAGNTQAARDAANLAMKLKAANVAVSNLMDVGSSLIQGAASSTTDFSAAVVSSLVKTIQTASAPLNLGSDTAVESILTQAASTAGVGASSLTALTAVIASTADKLSAATTSLNAQSTVTNAADVMGALTNMAMLERAVQSTISESVKAVAARPENVANLSGISLDLAVAAAATELPVQSFETLDFTTAGQGTLTGFLGAAVTKEVVSGNTVVKVIKPAGDADQFNASGVTVSTGANGALKTVTPMDLLSQSKLGMWVHSAKANTTVTLEVGDSQRGGHPKDLNFVAARAITTKAGWEYLSFDFDAPVQRYVAEGNPNGAVPTATPLKSGVTYDMLSVFFDLGQSKGSNQTYYFDKLGYFSATPGAAPADMAIEFAPARPSGYTLAWSDEFGGDLANVANAPKSPIDSDTWGKDLGAGGWGNGESQTYTDSINNAYEQNGALHIAADKTGSSITSARLKSVPDVGPNAYVEVRAKVPVGQGAWPAAWLLGQGQWPDTGEIDIMEWSSAYFNPSQTQSALHFRGDNNAGGNLTYGNTQKKGITTLGAPVTEFHTYQVWWTQDYIRFGVDANSDNAYYTYNKPANATSANWPFTGPMDLILNLAIGGSLGGTVPGGDFDYEMVVDYVRVYQGAASPSAPSAPTSAPTAPTKDAANVKSLFSDGYTAAVGATWSTDWDSVTGPEAVTLGGNAVKKYTNLNFLGIEPASPLNVGNMDTFHIDVWRSNAAADFKIKLVDFGANGVYGGGDDKEHEIVFNATNNNAVAANEWVSLDLPLSQFAGMSTKEHFAQLVMASTINGQASGESLWIDNVYFSRAATVTTPTSAPTAPTKDAANVKSLFSDGYTAAVGATWSTDWDSVTGPEAVTLGGNAVKKYTNLNFLGIEPASPLNVGNMDTFHIDVWRSNAAADFKIKLVDFGANGVYGGGDDKEHEIVFNATNNNAVAANEWVSLDLPLSQFAGMSTKEHFAQLVMASTINGQASGESLWIDNVYFSRAATVTTPTSAPTAPTKDAANVKSLFSDGYTAAVGATWSTDWDSVTGPEAVTLGGNAVKKYTNLNFLGIEPASPLNVGNMDTFHIDVWRSNAAADFKIKLVDFGANGVYGGGDDKEHEIVFNATNNNAVAANEWVSLDLPLSQFAGMSTKEHFAQLVMASTINGQASGESLWIDNVYFSRAATVTTPTSAPTAPTKDAANVKSLFSDGYTAAVGATWSTDWDSVTGPEAVTLGGNAVKKYTNLNFLGIEPASPLNVGNMDTFHIDVWRSNAAADFKIKLVDFGANGVYGGGDDKEHEIVFNATNNNAVAANEWVSLDLPLSQFAGMSTKEHFAQLVMASTINGQASGESLWIDNVYFSRAATVTTPTSAPTAPTKDAANVKSLFSDGYTAAVGATWSTDWDSVTGPEAVTLGGNAVKKYTNLNFLGIEPASPLNVGNMDTFHIDVWRSNAAADFKIKLVDFGANGVYGGGDDKEHEIVFNATNNNAVAANEWVSLDLPLSQFAGMSTKEHFAQLVMASTINGQASGESLWIDNVYFSRAATVTTPTSAPTAPTKDAANVKSLFSDGYTAAVGATWSTDWDSVTGPEAVTLGGNAVKKYTNLNFLGIEPASPLNVGNMDTFHIDVWRSNAAADFKIKLVDFGANGVYGGGDDKEHEIVFNATNNNAVAANEWVSLDLPLSQFAGMSTKEHFAQLVMASTINGQASGESLWIDNVYFSRAATVTTPTSAPTAPTKDAANVKSLFSDGYTAAVGATWSTDWDSVTGPEAVTLGGNAVKKYTNLNFLGIEPASPLNVGNMDTFHIDVWRSNAAADFKIKLVDFGANGVYGGGDDKEHEIVFNATNNNAVAANEWVSLDLPLSQFAGMSTKEHFAQLVMASTINGQASGESLWIDNVYFSRAATVTTPTSAPTAPTKDAANVKSLFSDGYTAAVGATWSTDWDSVTGPEAVTLGGNAVKKYTNLNFLGIEPASPLNVGNMDTFHIDVWRSNAAADFKIKLVDFGANGVYGGGDDKEHEIVFNATNNNAVAANEWVSLDLPLSQFAGMSTKEHFAQLVMASTINGQASGESLWIDNVYFSRAATVTTPTSAPTAPTKDAANVKSLFSDGYTAAVGATWSTDWDSVTGPEAVTLGGNAVKKYTNLNFLGIEPASPLNVGNMDTFHIDVWRSNAAADFKIKLVDFGANGVYGGGDDKEHEIVFNATNNNAVAANEWVSLDLPLSQFAGMSTKEHFAQLVMASTINGQASGESLWIDNVYFHNVMP